MSRWLVGWSWQSAMVASIWLAFGAAGWLAWGPITQPIQFTGKVSVQPEAVHPGGVVIVTREFTVREPVVLTVTRNLVLVDLPPKAATLTYTLGESRTMWKPDHYNNGRPHEIPDYVVPGRYRMDVVASWQANFLRHETRALTPVEFTVVAR